MLTWELVGAVVGAGLASGREVASFFSQYGTWSYAGILLAVGVMVWLADTSLPVCWKASFLEHLWHMQLSMLLIVTGGAMLSGAGEIMARALPLPAAYEVGMAGTLLLSWWLANRSTGGLAWVSKMLLGVLGVLIAIGLFLPSMKAAFVQETSLLNGVARSAAYGGFNAALQVPILAASMVGQQRRKHLLQAGGVIFCLLQLANGVLLRHPALLSEEMPFLRIAAKIGSAGYWLSSICLYLAVLSTLTACLRGLGSKWYLTAGVVCVSLLGFTGVVEKAYPLLGGGCFLLLLIAKFMNSFAKPFHSRLNML